ncbi:MAG: methyltransferase domain-containing protein, partial [Betaproteobacteria bacterium]|nr:methyltransferase domain-containing protein [Betaproteobacteria bacterium]
LLLPATAAMGATLPAIERQLSGAASRLGGLYAANTLGAVLGVLAVVFVAIPTLGLQRTAWVCSAINAACAVLALSLWRTPLEAMAAPANVQITSHDTMRTAPATLRPAIGRVLFFTGLLGIGYEVLAVRVLSQVTENTVYSYALLLAVYLLGTALGAALLQARKPAANDATESTLIQGLAAAILLGGATLWWADVICAWPARTFGASALTALAGEALAAVAAMLAPTLIMGALFTHLCQRAQAQSWPLGRALALNTTGAACAPFLFGVSLIPLVGPKWILSLIIGAYLALHSRINWFQPRVALPALAAIAVGLWASPLRFVDMSEGSTLQSYRDGTMAAVSIVEDSTGIARLRINNRTQEGSSARSPVEVRLAELPILLHPGPRSALFLGLGTGHTAQTAALNAGLQVTAVELLPEVIEAAAFFAPKSSAAPNEAPLKILAADARRYVQASPVQFDVIVADLFHPARSGAGSLYTVEHFAAVRRQLAPGGLFCQWLAVHQMNLQTVRSITAAFLQVYPDAVAVLASNSLDTPVLGLLSRPDQPRWNPDEVRASLLKAAPALHQPLIQARVVDEYAILGSILAGPQALRAFAGQIMPNTDDRPAVIHDAPWETYAPTQTPRTRLMTLVHQLQLKPDSVLRDASEETLQRLHAYGSARARYIEVGLTVRPDPDPLNMLTRLREPLLEILQQSPDFLPAYDPLFTLSRSLLRTEPGVAGDVLNALAAIRPTPSPNSR